MALPVHGAEQTQRELGPRRRVARAALLQDELPARGAGRRVGGSAALLGSGGVGERMVDMDMMEAAKKKAAADLKKSLEEYKRNAAAEVAQKGKDLRAARKEQAAESAVRQTEEAGRAAAEKEERARESKKGKTNATSTRCLRSSSAARFSASQTARLCARLQKL